MAIQNRRGNKADLNFSKLKIGELAVISDLGEIWAKLTASVTKRLATLNANGKLDQMPTAADTHSRPDTWMPTAADVGAATINGFPNVVCNYTGNMNTSYQFTAYNIVAGGVYLVTVRVNYNPAGSTNYRGLNCALILLPTGYAGSTICVKAYVNNLAGYTGTGFSATAMSVDLPNGVNPVALSTFNANPIVIIYVPKDAGAVPDTQTAVASVKRIL